MMFRHPGPIGLSLYCSVVDRIDKQGGAGVSKIASAFFLFEVIMGIFDKILSIFSGGSDEEAFQPAGTKTCQELAAWLGVELAVLEAVEPAYHQFTIAKRSGGKRQITAPSPELKRIQRKINRRLLSSLKSHPNVTGFEKGHSIVTNANFHANKAVVVRMDIKDFFASTSANRVRSFFKRVGWDEDASMLLTKLCTYENTLPQGAPTSPRLCNLINYPIDARLEALAFKLSASYSRYADDITFSFEEDDRNKIAISVKVTKDVIKKYGYKLHQKKKLRITRQHQRQKVTGLVVNEKVQLPRKTRRWLRAVKHHLENGRQVTLTDAQRAGWQALENMIEMQAE